MRHHRSAARLDRPSHATCGSPRPRAAPRPAAAARRTRSRAVRVHGHREQPTVRAEGDLPDRRVPAGERRADGRPAPRIEESKLPVDRSDGDELSIGVEGDRGDERTGVDPESLSSRRRVVHDRLAVELPTHEPFAVGAEGHVGGQIGRSAQRLSDRLFSAHVPDDRRTQVRAHQGPAVGAERDVVDRARVGRERGAVRRAGLHVPHEDRSVERGHGHQPPVRAEVTDRTRPWWPVRVVQCSPVRVSHSRTVLTGAGQGGAVRAVGHRPHGAGVAGEGGAVLAGAGVPQPYPAVVAGAGQSGAVHAVHNGIDESHMPRPNGHRSPIARSQLASPLQAVDPECWPGLFNRRR